MFQDWQYSDRLSALRRSYAARGQYVDFEPYAVAFDNDGVLFITRGSIIAGSIETPADADWYWFGISGRPVNEAQAFTLDAMPDLSVRFVQDQTGSFFARHTRLHAAPANASATDGWMPADNVVARNSEPFFWPYPVMFRRGDRLAIDWAYSTGALFASINLPSLSLHGFKAYTSRRAA